MTTPREKGFVKSPPTQRPLLIFDGECNFCRHWIARWQEMTGSRVDYRPYQEVGTEFPEIPQEAFQKAVQLVEPDGRLFDGADAVFRLPDFASTGGRFYRLLRSLPGLLAAARPAYRFVSSHRPFFSLITRLFWGKTFRKPAFLFSRWLFLRVLGLVYLIAFVSLAIQILGLVGERGILPARQFFDAAGAQLGFSRYWILPTVFWWNASDAFLVGICWAGAGISALLVAGIWPSACLALLWLLYLSLCVACRTFLGYQWDALLLETGFLAIFLIPLFEMRPRWNLETGGSRVARWLLLWLAFRITIESGLVKLASHDPAWANLTALTYHYETQPLPLWTAWFANQLPLWIQKMSCAGIFVVELGAPFLIIAPRNLRLAGAGAMIALQAGIAATGNYTFFNLLTGALYLLLLDDAPWPVSWKKVLEKTGLPHPGRFGKIVHGALLAPVALIHTFFSCLPLLDILGFRKEWPAPIVQLHRLCAAFRSCNGYGLFAVMTTTRPEIIIEGSGDGLTWEPYEFGWKPGNVYERPKLCAPHQPRLDWQMWFASLEAPQVSPWLYHFAARLLEGSPEVLRLLESNPFPKGPPLYVRATLYEYHFTRFEDATEAWWKREYKGILLPPVSLRTSE
ncbi:MAG: hypothetical protein JWL59_5159 [Chthoniobacteraceae bacterium]|nr:hypothetical protein [Chthoniobacteraceae bacterium]